MEVEKPSTRSPPYWYSGGDRQSYDGRKSIGGRAKWKRAFSPGKASSGDYGCAVYHP